MPDTITPTAPAVTDRPPPLAFIYDRRMTPTRAVLRLRLATCHEYAAELRWEVAGEWVDVDAHALSDHNRPQFEDLLAAMRRAAAAGRTVVLLLHAWDRLSRDAGRQSAFLRYVTLAGGYTATYSGEDDRRPEDGQLKQA